MDIVPVTDSANESASTNEWRSRPAMKRMKPSEELGS